MEALLNAAIKSMAKFTDNEEVQIRGLELLDKASQVSSTMANLVIKLGGSSHILSKLEAGTMPSKRTAVHSLQILDKLCSNKEALNLLANQSK